MITVSCVWLVEIRPGQPVWRTMKDGYSATHIICAVCHPQSRKFYAIVISPGSPTAGDHGRFVCCRPEPEHGGKGMGEYLTRDLHGLCGVQASFSIPGRFASVRISRTYFRFGWPATPLNEAGHLPVFT